MSIPTSSPPRVVVVGAGFAGYEAARGLLARLGGRAEVLVLNSTDYFLYLPLMPQVAGGLVCPVTSVSRCRESCGARGSSWARSTPSIRTDARSIGARRRAARGKRRTTGSC